MTHQTATVNDTVYFWFAANDTSGSGGDGATPLYDVREAGAAAGAIPLLSGTPTLLTHANYPAGCHEISVAATTGNGFAADDTFAVFCTLAVDSQNPTGFVGSCTLTPLAKAAGVLLAAGAITNASLAGNMEVVFETGFATNYNVTRNAWVTNFTDILGTYNAQTGDSFARLGVAGAGLTNLGASGNDWNTVVPDAAGTAATPAEVATALTDIHLDHFFATDYDPASKPGTATAWANEMVESDAGVTRYTVNALENGPSGSGASAAAIADAVWDELLAGHAISDSAGELLNDWQNGGRLDAILDSRMAEASINTTAGAVDNVTLVATTTTNTDMVGTDGANTTTPLDAAGIRTAVGLASANMDTQFTASATATGFATPTNITAGTITTTTNLTNAATSGDLTATMKTSVNTQVDTALADIGLDHLISTTLPTNWATDVASGSVFDNIADNGTAAFDRTTDSLQAIADAGATDPWGVAIPGSYTAGEAGFILGNMMPQSGLTASGNGTTTTLVDTALTQANDYWNGATIQFHTGSADNDVARTVTDFDAATDTLTFSPALLTATATNDVYSLQPTSNGVLEVDTSGRVDVGSWLGTAVATPTTAGVPEVDTTHVSGTAQTANDNGADINTLITEIGTAGAGLTNLGASGNDWNTVVPPTVAQMNARTLVSAGYATPTNITAGTITTVTNLTNAATSGDLTATMKTSVNAEVDTAIETYRLDELFNIALGSQPAAGSFLGDLTEDNAGTQRFTTAALANAPSGTGGDATEAKQDQIIAAVITNAAGVDIAADIIAVKSETATIVADTGELQTNQGNWLTVTGHATEAKQDVIDTNVDAILVDTADLQANQGNWVTATGFATDTKQDTMETTLNAVPSVSDILTTQMTESYAADGAAPTLAQALMMCQQMLGEFSISGTTLTMKRVDGSTTGATFTLDDGTNPTSLTRAT